MYHPKTTVLKRPTQNLFLSTIKSCLTLEPQPQSPFSKVRATVPILPWSIPAPRPQSPFSVKTNSPLVNTRAPTPFSFLLGGNVRAGPALVNIRNSIPISSLKWERQCRSFPGQHQIPNPDPGGSTRANPAPVVPTPTEEVREVLCGFSCCIIKRTFFLKK